MHFCFHSRPCGCHGHGAGMASFGLLPLLCSGGNEGSTQSKTRSTIGLGEACVCIVCPQMVGTRILAGESGTVVPLLTSAASPRGVQPAAGACSLYMTSYLHFPCTYTIARQSRQQFRRGLIGAAKCPSQQNREGEGQACAYGDPGGGGGGQSVGGGGGLGRCRKGAVHCDPQNCTDQRKRGGYPPPPWTQISQRVGLIVVLVSSAMTLI